MNKRQKKKKEKKYLLIIADEFNLLTMTEEEKKEAFKGYNRYRERFAYRKRYKDLKNDKPLQYYFPVGRNFSNAMSVLSNSFIKE